MNEDFLYNNPLAFYEALILGSLTKVYEARKETYLVEWMQYSNLLIDKFAIHSSTFFHLSSGIIESKDSGEIKRMMGYDLFTINTTIRAIIETYVTFNHIFVEPKTKQEKYFRFLLWKLDGLYQEKRYDIKTTDFDEVSRVLQEKEDNIKKTINQIENSDFIKGIPKEHINRVFNPAKRKVNWRFLFENDKIIVLQIIGLIEHCCKTRAFVNTYKHSSIHTHSNFPAIEEFKQCRGKVMSTEYTDSITRVGIFLTSLMIYDICEIDENAKKRLGEIDIATKNFIIGLSKSIKKSK